MRRTKRLCAVMLDCLGRELMIKRKYGVDENGWPGIFDQLNITAGQRVVITTDTTRECTNELLPITYPKFPAMCEPGDQIFLGRYLVTGADDSSVFLEVRCGAAGAPSGGCRRGGGGGDEKSHAGGRWTAAMGGSNGFLPCPAHRTTPPHHPFSDLTSPALPPAQVDEVTPTEVVCRARNNGVLDGLLTVFHIERSTGVYHGGGGNVGGVAGGAGGDGDGDWDGGGAESGAGGWQGGLRAGGWWTIWVGYVPARWM